ncbi:MAG: DUF2232 domain-containing protein [Gammaproteobacteria bacterium]|nr:DUF2232 domain-containing protein [Gammaproteobacteria bacterium]
MKALASFILRGPSQAILVVVGTAVLAMMLPPLSVVSSAALGLITLRMGWRYGATVMLGSTAFAAGLAWVSLGNALPGLVFLGVVWLPLWVLGWVLRETRSLAVATVTAGSFGIASVLLTYLLLGDVTAWWQQVLLNMFEPAMESGGPLAERSRVESMLAEIAPVMTGILAAGMVINALVGLYLARGWQAMLYNPGGFRSEFYALRLGKIPAYVALVVVALSLLPLGGLAAVAGQVAIVVLALYVVQGLALIHAIVALRKLHVAWLVSLYVVTFFVMPHLLALMALVGLADTWIDFRRREGASV